MTGKYYSLYGRLLSHERLENGFKKVKSAKGAPGIDGQSVKDFAENLEENIVILLSELREKRYRPKPVRRVEIPKEDGGKRMLGIPAVRDRVVQQVLLDVLQPIFEPDFHPSSYGYRPKRSSHQAIAKAEMFIREYNFEWVVDMDLSKCFDMLDHDIILNGFKKKVTDGSILKLLKMFLESGVITEDGFKRTEIGSPQGGVISPLIANVYLDEFDWIMKARGNRIVRYADDILIFTRSESGAENAMKQASKLFEKRLKLKVNKVKSHTVHSSKGVKFLGVVIYTKYTSIQEKKLSGFKSKIRKITRRNSPVNVEQVIKELNPILRGFANYFRIANCSSEFRKLMSWIRRRLRSKQLRLWKRPMKLHRRLRQLGYAGEFSFIRMSSWRNSASPLAHYSMPNKWFTEIGLFNMEEVKIGLKPEFY